MKTQSSVELRLLLKIKDCSSVDVCSVVHLTLEKPGRAAHRCDNKQDVIKIRVDWLFWDSISGPVILGPTKSAAQSQ